MKKLIALTLAAASCTLTAGAAQARSDVSWSIGVNLPPIGVAVGNAPVIGAPIYVEPAPVYYPAYPQRVHVVPRTVYRTVPVYAPRTIVYHRDGDRGRHWRDHDGRRGDRGHRGHRDWDRGDRDWDRGERGDRRGRQH